MVVCTILFPTGRGAPVGTVVANAGAIAVVTANANRPAGIAAGSAARGAVARMGRLGQTVVRGRLVILSSPWTQCQRAGRSQRRNDRVQNWMLLCNIY